jgi:hypothetical protein
MCYAQYVFPVQDGNDPCLRGLAWGSGYGRRVAANVLNSSGRQPKRSGPPWEGVNNSHSKTSMYTGAQTWRDTLERLQQVKMGLRSGKWSV